MSLRLRLASCFFLLGAAITALSGEPNPIKELTPRQVTFSATQLTLNEALAELQKQTGNVVNDVRTNRTNPTIMVPTKPTKFWEALDAIAKETNIGVSAYQPDGGVALVDRAHRELKTDYSGIFRFAFKRVAVSRDLETQAHNCDVTLDIAWEPHFRPLLVNLEAAEVTYLTDKRVRFLSKKVGRQAAREVAGAGATDIELRTPAAARDTAKIHELMGTVKVIGAPKLLEFKLVKPKSGMDDEQEGVKVRLVRLEKFPKQFNKGWEADLETEHPKDALLKLESFQDSLWMQLTRVWLSWTDAKSGKIVELEGSDYPSTTGIGYRFASKAGQTPLPSTDAAVTLHYRVPNRIVAFTVPFAFQDLPLP